jgi:transposase
MKLAKQRSRPMIFNHISVDSSKSVFTLHGVDEDGKKVSLRKDLSRGQFLAYFEKLPPTDVYMEACGASHHWARKLQAIGHRVRLIPPQYVKPFVKRGKNDRNDAAAISDAASRPEMRFVPVKSAERQADGLDMSFRQLLLGQRTQMVNALRGHAAEFGIVIGKGIKKVDALIKMIADDPEAPATAKAALARIGEQITYLDMQIAEADARLAEQHKNNATSQLLDAIPGVGPVIALAMALMINPAQFQSGRHFAAWLGLTPRERSTGGRHTMGGISRAGHEGLRALLVSGAMSVVRHAKPDSKNANPWLLDLLDRKPRKLAAVALANKMARIIWAMMSTGEVYRQPKAA